MPDRTTIAKPSTEPTSRKQRSTSSVPTQEPTSLRLLPTVSPVRVPGSEKLLPPLARSELSADLAKYGVDLKLVASALEDLLKDEKNPSERLGAVSVYFKWTTPPPPTTSKSYQIHSKTDKFFDPVTFENPGPPKLDEE